MDDNEAPPVQLERREDGVALVRLQRPKMNALSSALLTALEAIALDLSDNPPGAVVVWGGERIFAAGADISEFGGPDEARMLGGRFRAALDKLASIPRMTIAAINGYALGGGCELALACDLRIAGQGAKLGQPEILLGIIPGGGGTQRLTRLVGSSRAKEMILTGRHVTAEEAYRIGLVDRVVPDELVLDTALAMASELAKGPLVAQALAKKLIDMEGPLDAGLDAEQKGFIRIFESSDAKVGVTSFKEHGPGKATFTGS